MGTALAEILYWVVMPICIGVGSSLLVWLLMHARAQVLRAGYDAAIAALEHRLELLQVEHEAAIGRQAERARAEALEVLLREIRVERRQFERRTRRLFRTETAVEIQERLSIHRIPLTEWVPSGVLQPPSPARTGVGTDSPTPEFPLSAGVPLCLPGGAAGPL